MEIKEFNEENNSYEVEEILFRIWINKIFLSQKSYLKYLIYSFFTEDWEFIKEFYQNFLKELDKILRVNSIHIKYNNVFSDDIIINDIFLNYKKVSWLKFRKDVIDYKKPLWLKDKSTIKKDISKEEMENFFEYLKKEIDKDSELPVIKNLIESKNNSPKKDNIEGKTSSEIVDVFEK